MPTNEMLIIQDHISTTEINNFIQSNIPLIHIFIPAYNEEKAIKNVLIKTEEILNQVYPFRITIIDDGSKDKTIDIIKKCGIPVDLKINKQNRGKGFSLHRALNLVSSNEIVVLMDADGEHKPDDIPNLIKPLLLKQADMVVGSRFLRNPNDTKKHGSYQNNGKKFGYIRQFGNLLFSVLVFIFHRKFLSDTQCGFRAFAPGVINSMCIKSKGFQIETEITINCIKKGYRIEERYIQSGQSKRNSHMKMVFDSFKIILVIIDMSLSTRLQKIFRRVFSNFLSNS